MEIGEICYNGYKKSRGGITWNGEKMKDFDDMPEDIQESWEDAGQCVLDSKKKPKRIYTKKEIIEREENKKEKEREKNEKLSELRRLKEDSRKYHELLDGLKIIEESR